MKKGKTALMAAMAVAVGLTIVSAFAGCGRDRDGTRPGPLSILIAASNMAGVNTLYSLMASAENGRLSPIVFQTDLGGDPRLDPMLVTKDNNIAQGPFVIRREAWGANLGSIAALMPGPRHELDYVFQVNDGVNPANPQDLVLLAQDRAYVTRFEPPYNDILIVDPQTGAFLGNIDLTPFADQLPRPTKMFAAYGLIFVVLQDFSAGWPAVFSNGKIAVIDPATDMVIEVIQLTLTNPSSFALIPGRNQALFSFAGDWGDTSLAGLELVDLAGRASAGVIVTGDQPEINGFLTDVAWLGGGMAAVINSRADWSGSDVLPVIPAGGLVLPPVYFSGYVADLEACGPNFFVIADNAGSRAALMDSESFEIIEELVLDTPPANAACW